MAFSISLILLGIVLGLPLFAALGMITILLFSNSGIDPTVVIVELSRVASAPTLMAIPLFTLAGYILAESKAPRRIFALADAAFGWMPGGLAVVSLGVCALFTCLTGASGITIVAIGGLIFPLLRKKGYSESFSMGLITCSGSLGLLFPPSLPLILYSTIASVAVDKMFLAGILPGFLIIIVLSIYGFFKDPDKFHNRTRFDFRNVIIELQNAAWEIPIPVIIIGGIYGGLITVNEAAAVTAFYVFVIEFFINKDLSVKIDLIRVFSEAVRMIGGILIILCAAMGFTGYLIDAQIPHKALTVIQTLVSSKVGFLILLNIFLLITGAVLDIFSAIIIIVPFIVPIAIQYGIDPVHLGIIFLTNLEIGYLTPPVGMNLFIASFRFKKPIIELYRASLPFILILLGLLLLITFVPQISLIWM